MAKLYHEGDRWVVPGKQGGDARRVDVPNSPDALADWLNAREVAPTPPTAAPPADGNPAPEQPEPAAARPTFSVDAIADWLLDVATQAEVEAVFAAIGARWGEARK